MVTRQTRPNLPPASNSTSTTDDLIQMHDVVKTFKNAAGEFTVLHGIDLTIQRGDTV